MARKPQIILSSLDVDRIEALLAAMVGFDTVNHHISGRAGAEVAVHVDPARANEAGLSVAGVPSAPAGTEVARVDVIVRLRARE